MKGSFVQLASQYLLCPTRLIDNEFHHVWYMFEPILLINLSVNPVLGGFGKLRLKLRHNESETYNPLRGKLLVDSARCRDVTGNPRRLVF